MPKVGAKIGGRSTHGTRIIKGKLPTNYLIANVRSERPEQPETSCTPILTETEFVRRQHEHEEAVARAFVPRYLPRWP